MDTAEATSAPAPSKPRTHPGFILGIDPGTANCGWVVRSLEKEGWPVVAAGVHRFLSDDANLTTTPTHQWMDKLISFAGIFRDMPGIIVMEQQYGFSPPAVGVNTCAYFALWGALGTRTLVLNGHAVKKFFKCSTGDRSLTKGQVSAIVEHDAPELSWRLAEGEVARNRFIHAQDAWLLTEYVRRNFCKEDGEAHGIATAADGSNQVCEPRERQSAADDADGGCGAQDSRGNARRRRRHRGPHRARI